LTEPRAQKPRREVEAAKTCRRAATSMGSPSGVAVPCPSTKPIVSGSTPATAWAMAITPACPPTPGAVKPIRSSPSLLTAVPRITACT
jgi:hypothetical protein